SGRMTADAGCCRSVINCAKCGRVSLGGFSGSKGITWDIGGRKTEDGGQKTEDGGRVVCLTQRTRRAQRSREACRRQGVSTSPVYPFVHLLVTLRSRCPLC